MDRDERLAVQAAMRNIFVFNEFATRETLNDFGWPELLNVLTRMRRSHSPSRLQGECLSTSPAINDVMSAPFQIRDALEPAPNVILVSGGNPRLSVDWLESRDRGLLLCRRE